MHGVGRVPYASVMHTIHYMRHRLRPRTRVWTSYATIDAVLERLRHTDHGGVRLAARSTRVAEHERPPRALVPRHFDVCASTQPLISLVFLPSGTVPLLIY